MSEPTPPPQTTFEIFVDGQRFPVHQSSMTAEQIKALVGKDAQYQLFEEIPGGEKDRLIPDGSTVAIRGGIHFYTVASASFGTSNGFNRRSV